jgi:hypothetical protein
MVERSEIGAAIPSPLVSPTGERHFVFAKCQQAVFVCYFDGARHFTSGTRGTVTALKDTGQVHLAC